MNRQGAVAGTALVLMSLIGCQHNPVDRLLGIEKHTESAPAPVSPTGDAPPSASPTPSPAALPRYETYRFSGNVKADGNGYYGAVAPGDAVTGTFRIDYEQPIYFNSAGFRVYDALTNIQGTVGGYTFSGDENLVYVKGDSSTPYWVDTGYLTLDGTTMAFDLFFQLQSGTTGDSSLASLRDLDKRAYSNVDLWFETNARSGTGFNVQITTLQRADPPLTLASAR